MNRNTLVALQRIESVAARLRDTDQSKLAAELDDGVQRLRDSLGRPSGQHAAAPVEPLKTRPVGLTTR